METLEDRIVPASLDGFGPYVSVHATVLAGHYVELTGQVTDDTNPSGAVVTFGGAAAGNSTTTDANGLYDITTNEATLGTATVSAVDQDGDNCFADSGAPIQTDSPIITLSITSSTATTVSIAGTATGIDKAGATVSISGLASATLTADSSGNFSTTLTTSAGGTIDANTTDLWGQASNTAEVDYVVVTLANPGTQMNFDGDTVNLPVTASDSAGNPLSYTASPLPSGLTIDPNSGIISGTIAGTADTDSPYAVTLTATDSTAGVSASQTFKWLVIGPPVWGQNPPSPPVITNPGDQTNAEGDSVSLTIGATDPGNNAMTFAAVGLPDGLSIDSTTGAITGTVDYGDATDFNGTYQTTIIVADTAGANANVTFNWTINVGSVGSVGPVITAPPGQSNSAGDTVSLQVTGSDPDGNPLDFSASGLPTGLSIDASTGLISGTIDPAAGSSSPSSVTVYATDNNGTASQTFNWTVAAVALPPQLANPGDQSDVVGDPVSLDASGSDADGDTLTYTATGLPDGLSIDPASGLISGTVANDAASTTAYQVTVTVADGAVTASQAFSWTVPFVSLANPGDELNVDGDVVSLPNYAVDATGATLTFSATGLPTGLTIDPTAGTISGTVDNAADAQSPYNVTVTATDGTYSDAQSFVWTVISPSVLVDPTIVNPGDQSGYAGETVSLITQDTGPYLNAVNFSADNLPDGTSIDPNTGIISGTIADDAVSTSAYSVTVSAFDAYGDTTSETLNWTVAPATLSITAPAISATQGVDPGIVNVATFTTPDTNSQASDFTATVDWGDGISEQVQVTGANGSFAVPDDHVYTSPGSFTVTVSITDSTGGNADASAQATATVADSLAASGGLTGAFVEPAIVNQSASLTLATLESTDLTPSDFTVQIDWGDGSTPSPITLGASQNGMYQIGGQHLYAADGAYTATISVTDSFGTTLTTTSTVNVGDLYAGIPATLTLGSFTAPDPDTTYTATIAWGDGGSSTATVTEIDGAVTIIGTHTYAQSGTFQPTITVTPAGAAPITANAPSVQVVSAQITLYASNAEATTGSTLLATFTDANPSDTAANFTATLIWGDGTTSNATITGGNGLFSISDSRTFTQRPVLAPQVLVSENLNLVDVAQPEVEVAPVDGGSLIGPSVVPGNSVYFFAIPDTVDLTDSWANSATTVSAGGSIKAWWVNGLEIQFANTPATVVITYVKSFDGVLKSWTKSVDVVQITVAQAGTFTDAGGGGVTDGSFYVDAKSDRIRYTANVTLTAPTDPVTRLPKTADLTFIKIGFTQLVTVTRFTAAYMRNDTPCFGNAFYVDATGRPLQGQTFLDSIDAINPWYSLRATGYADTEASQNGVLQEIGGNDAPGASVRRTFFAFAGDDWSPSRYGLIGFNGVSNFRLNVTASLAGAKAEDSDPFWSEAQVGWATDMGFMYQPDGFGGIIDKDNTFGLTLPTAWSNPPGAPEKVRVNLPMANATAGAGEWRVRVG